MCEELKAAYERITDLEQIVSEFADYFAVRSDVVDGDYGVPAPNEAMKILQILEEVL